MRHRRLPALVVALLTISCGDDAIRRSNNRQLTVIFEGFAYVGCFPDSQGAELPPHGVGGLTLPNRLMPGFRYVFHFPKSPGDTLSPLEVLPKRLRDSGFQTVGPINLISLNSGGPVYEINFSGRGCAGHVQHEVDKNLLGSRLPWKRKWEPDDTVLTVGEGCNL